MLAESHNIGGLFAYDTAWPVAIQQVLAPKIRVGKKIKGREHSMEYGSYVANK